MSTHTPGPWTAEPNGGDDTDPRKLFICANRGAETTIIAEVFTGMDEDAEASARLISAAPELLAALKALSAGLHDGVDSNPRIKAAEVRAARAAIAKAEGGS